jgi:hypothetical protein
MTPRIRLPACVATALLGLCAGCETARTHVRAEDPRVAAFLEIAMPRELEVQRYLTRPASYSSEGRPDGLEVILATRDSFGDPVKVIGDFHFELSELRLASGDRVGRRVALWSVAIATADDLRQYWDRMARFLRFSLRFASPQPAPGRYILTVWLVTPTGEKVGDTYEFELGATAPAPVGQ